MNVNGEEVALLARNSEYMMMDMKGQDGDDFII